MDYFDNGVLNIVLIEHIRVLVVNLSDYVDQMFPKMVPV